MLAPRFYSHPAGISAHLSSKACQSSNQISKKYPYYWPFVPTSFRCALRSCSQVNSLNAHTLWWHVTGERWWISWHNKAKHYLLDNQICHGNASGTNVFCRISLYRISFNMHLGATGVILLHCETHQDVDGTTTILDSWSLTIFPEENTGNQQTPIRSSKRE